MGSGVAAMRVLPWSPAQLGEKNVSGTVSRLYLRFLTPVYLSKAQLQISYQCQYGGGVCQNSEGAIDWFDKAGDQGHDQANYFAKDLKQWNCYIGFRNEQEHAAVVGNKLGGFRVCISYSLVAAIGIERW